MYILERIPFGSWKTTITSWFLYKTCLVAWGNKDFSADTESEVALGKHVVSGNIKESSTCSCPDRYYSKIPILTQLRRVWHCHQSFRSSVRTLPCAWLAWRTLPCAWSSRPSDLNSSDLNTFPQVFQPLWLETHSVWQRKTKVPDKIKFLFQLHLAPLSSITVPRGADWSLK